MNETVIICNKFELPYIFNCIIVFITKIAKKRNHLEREIFVVFFLIKFKWILYNNRYFWALYLAINLQLTFWFWLTIKKGSVKTWNLYKWKTKIWKSSPQILNEGYENGKKNYLCLRSSSIMHTVEKHVDTKIANWAFTNPTFFLHLMNKI